MSEKNLQERLDYLVQVSENAAIYKERWRILKGVLALDMPCIPLEDIRRLIADTNND